jgi:hypothetical protein
MTERQVNEWKLTPREPTEEMHAAANREWDGRMSARSAGVWQAMWDAAPPPPSLPADVREEVKAIRRAAEKARGKASAMRRAQGDDAALSFYWSEMLTIQHAAAALLTKLRASGAEEPDAFGLYHGKLPGSDGTVNLERSGPLPITRPGPRKAPSPSHVVRAAEEELDDDFPNTGARYGMMSRSAQPPSGLDPETVRKCMVAVQSCRTTTSGNAAWENGKRAGLREAEAALAALLPDGGAA